MTKNSTYCALLPADDKTLNLLNLISDQLGIHHTDRTKHGFHITMLYDKNNGTDKTGFVPDPDVVYKAKIQGIKVFRDCDKSFLVLTLTSSDIAKRHNQILFKGHKHSFPEFNPHVTLAKHNAGAYAVEALGMAEVFRFEELSFNSEYVQELE